MTWNFRVIRRKDNEGYYDAIHEVYYKENGEIDSITENPISVLVNKYDIEEGHSIVDELNRMIEGAAKPVIDYDTLKEIDEDTDN